MESKTGKRYCPSSEQQLLALASVLLAQRRGSSLLDRVEMTLGSEQLKKILQPILRAFDHLHQHRKSRKSSAIFIKLSSSTARMVGGPGPLTRNRDH